MATIPQGFLGPFNGKMGSVIGYTWRQRACLRAYPEHVRYPNTEQQQRERDWFVSMVRFASRAKEALQLGMHQSSIEAGMTEGNYFILRNKQHFHHEGDKVEINYSQLCLSEGTASDVYFRVPHFEADEVVSVDFEKNTMFSRASSDDKVYLFIYAPALETSMLSAPVERRSKHISIRLPEAWAGTVVHLYGFVIDHNGRASLSTYIGEGRVNHYEDRSLYIPTDTNWQEFVDIAAANNDADASVQGVNSIGSARPKESTGHTDKGLSLPPG